MIRLANADKGRFGGLFKPAWQSRSADKRLSAVARLDTDDAKDREILGQLARDPEDAVALAAIARVDDLAVLDRLIEERPGESRQGAARRRFGELLADAESIDFVTATARLGELPGRVAEFAAHAAFEPLRRQALDSLPPAQRQAVLEATPHTDTRQWIVQQLESLDDLLAARKRLRGKDKNAERLLKERIDAIRRDQRQQQELDARARELIEQAEYFSSHDGLPNFGPRVRELLEAWAAIDGQLDATLREQFAQAGQAMRERFEQQPQLEQVAAEQAALLAEIQSALDAVREQDLDSLTGNASAIRDSAARHAEAWAELAGQLALEPDAAERADQLLGALQAAADFAESAGEAESPAQALRALHWPQAFGKLRAAAQLEEQLEAERRAQSAEQRKHQQELDRVHKQIGKIARLAKAGHLGPAHGLCRSVEAELENHEGNDRQALQDRLDAAREALQKMDDWKNFATEPKYRELCEAMEKLVDSQKHPDALAGEIRTLQQAWKSLGHSAISDQYWERFKTASDAAWEPCKRFFEQRRETRAEQLALREAVVERLRELDEQAERDETPDYRGLQRKLAEIQRDFQAIKDVEREAGAEQWARFKALRDAVQQRLAPEYERNHEAQQRLIGLMQALADAPPAADTLDKMKSLQQRWKQIGITRPRDGRKAWAEFQQAGDRCYENLQSQRRQQREEQDAALEQRRTVIRAIHELAGEADQLADLDHRYAELEQQYAELPALPRDTPEKLQKSVDGEYRKAASAVDRARDRILARQRQAQLAALRERAALCLELEAPGLDDAGRADIDQRWEQVELSDPELARRIEARRQAATTERDVEAIGHERRLFCIETEISLEVSSPEEDRALRMQHQLERMNEHGLGQAPAAMRSAEELEIEWLCRPGAEPELQRQLDERFRRCLEQAAAGSGKRG